VTQKHQQLGVIGPSWAVVPQENNTFCAGKYEQVKLFLFMS